MFIELGGRNVIHPNETHTVSPYISGLTQGLVYPNSAVVVPARDPKACGKNVVLSTLTLVELEADLRPLCCFCEQHEFLVEATDPLQLVEAPSLVTNIGTESRRWTW